MLVKVLVRAVVNFDDMLHIAIMLTLELLLLNEHTFSCGAIFFINFVKVAWQINS